MGRGPAALGNRLAGEVYHPIGLGDGQLEAAAGPAGGVSRIALDAVEPLTHQGGKGLELAAHQGELMAQLQQQGHQLTADKA